ncbi:S24 family peptidase [Cytobacillus horneckiae]|uniref:LexA family protein n=1 Tax=Cytobacillus horneckiae TaxID=549687 RepID=UPI00399FF906
MIEEQKKIIVSNIKKFLKERKMTQSELAEAIHIAKSTMSDYMNYRAKPSSGVLEKMAAVFGVTKADIDTTYKNKRVELINGELKLINDHDTTEGYKIASKAENLIVNENTFNYNQDYKIPIIGKIAAGSPIDAIQDVVDSIHPPYETTQIEDLFGLVVNGDSMNKIVPNGNYAILKKQSCVENGEIAAVAVNGDYATLKKVYKFTDLIILEPYSYDESYTDQKYTNQNCDDIKIIGKFLYSVSPMISK